MARLNRFGSRLDEFSRRGFLGGTGAALMVGLPMLETFWSRKSRAAAPGTPRLLCMAAGNGLPMDELTPATTGANYAFNQGAGTWGTNTIWRSFAPLRAKTSIITGLGIAEGRHDPGRSRVWDARDLCVHQAQPGHAEARHNHRPVMANKYAAQTPIFPQGLQLAMAQGAAAGDGPFGATYLTNLSWRSATVFNPPSYNPQQVFQSLFKGTNPTATAAQNDRTAARQHEHPRLRPGRAGLASPGAEQGRQCPARSVLLVRARLGKLVEGGGAGGGERWRGVHDARRGAGRDPDRRCRPFRTRSRRCPISLPSHSSVIVPAASCFK